MLWKCCIQYTSKYGKLSTGHMTIKGQFSFQSQRKAMPKNVKTTTQLHISHMLAKQCSKCSKIGFKYVNQELPDVQAVFIKGRGTRDKIVNICWIIEKAREFQKKSTSVSLTTLKPLTVWITTKCKILKEMGVPDHLTCPLRKLYAGRSNS